MGSFSVLFLLVSVWILNVRSYLFEAKSGNTLVRPDFLSPSLQQQQEDFVLTGIPSEKEDEMKRILEDRPTISERASGNLTPVYRKKEAKLNDAYSLIYSWIDEETLLFESTVATTGWVGIGFGYGMSDVDMVIGMKFGSQALLFDYYGEGEKLPSEDTTKGGTNDVNLIEGTESDGTTRLKWIRYIDTGDQYDEVLTVGSLRLSWAYGQSDALNTHGLTNRGNALVEFRKDPLEEGDDPNEVDQVGVVEVATKINSLYLVHGITLYTLWVIIFPISIIVVRCFRVKDYWIKLHQALNTTVAAVTVPMAATMTAFGNNQEDNIRMHLWIGMVLSFSCLYLMCIGKILAHSLKREKVTDLTNLKRAHRWPGWVCWTLSWLNCYYGLVAFDSHWVPYLILSYLLVLSIMGIFMLWFFYPNLRIFRLMKVNIGLNSVEQKRLIPKLTMDEFLSYVLLDNCWMVIGDLIINLNDYKKYHPGGSSILSQMKGKDAIKFFFGNYRYGARIRDFHHSLHASKLSERLICGILAQPEGFRFLRKHGAHTKETEFTFNEWILDKKERLALNLEEMKMINMRLFVAIETQGVEWFGKYYMLKIKVDGLTHVRYYTHCSAIQRFQRHHSAKAIKLIEKLRSDFISGRINPLVTGGEQKTREYVFGENARDDAIKDALEVLDGNTLHGEVMTKRVAAPNILISGNNLSRHQNSSHYAHEFDDSTIQLHDFEIEMIDQPNNHDVDHAMQNSGLHAVNRGGAKILRRSKTTTSTRKHFYSSSSSSGFSSDENDERGSSKSSALSSSSCSFSSMDDPDDEIESKRAALAKRVTTVAYGGTPITESNLVTYSVPLTEKNLRLAKKERSRDKGSKAHKSDHLKKRAKSPKRFKKEIPKPEKDSNPTRKGKKKKSTSRISHQTPTSPMAGDGVDVGGISSAVKIPGFRDRSHDRKVSSTTAETAFTPLHGPHQLSTATGGGGAGVGVGNKSPTSPHRKGHHHHHNHGNFRAKRRRSQSTKVLPTKKNGYMHTSNSDDDEEGDDFHAHATSADADSPTSDSENPLLGNDNEMLVDLDALSLFSNPVRPKFGVSYSNRRLPAETTLKSIRRKNAHRNSLLKVEKSVVLPGNEKRRNSQSKNSKVNDKDSELKFRNPDVDDHSWHDGSIYLYIKKYPTGIVTPCMSALDQGCRLWMKGPLGGGLFLTATMKGNFAGFAAGTGILPFLDLIYFLYRKEVKMREFQNLPKDVIDSISFEDLPEEDFSYLTALNDFTFTLFATFSDVASAPGYPLLITAANECLKSKRFRLKLTFTKEAPDYWHGHNGRFSIDFFSRNLPEKVSRCYICGPDEYADSIYDLLKDHGLSNDFIYTL